MRIIQTVNDTIRLLFNPKTEIFRLSDFLLVRDVDENFLAQVVEVYDDKFDQEANVAKIKLIYRIVNGNEITPFDNYTPSRECEVAKIKQSEIVKCINLNKKTIELGVNCFSKEKMKINTNFFENNCVIFADKFEQTNQIFENLAPRLSLIKPVLILDFSGNCRVEGITPFVAGENFKLPLSSSTIDYIQQKTLIRAKLETQVVLGDVFEEVKSYLESSDDDYIPFQRFIKVIQTQCRQTPSVELLVLISWLKKYSRQGIFAKNKREADTLFKSVSKNKITILDLSNIKTDWQKEHFEYIVNTIKNNVFVLIRLNDNNINGDIINSVYLKKNNITLVPSFAYGYKKTPHIMDFAQNYILLPTLNPKRDFGHANFQIQSLNKDAYMIFGDDTKDFIFTLENKSLAKNINKDDNTKDKVFISLNLQLEDMTPLELRPNNFEIKQAEPKRRRLQEEIKLSDVLSAERSDDEIKGEDAEILTNEEAKEEIKSTASNNSEETFVLDAPKPVEIPLNQEDENQDITSIEEEKEISIEDDIEEIQYEKNVEAEIIEEDEQDKEDVENPEVILGEDELDFFEQPEINEDEYEETDENDASVAKEENLPKIKESEPEEETKTVEFENELESFAMAQKEALPEENTDIKNTTKETDVYKNEIEEADNIVSNIINQAVQEQTGNSKEDIEIQNKDNKESELPKEDISEYVNKELEEENIDSFDVKDIDKEDISDEVEPVEESIETNIEEPREKENSKAQEEIESGNDFEDDDNLNAKTEKDIEDIEENAFQSESETIKEDFTPLEDEEENEFKNAAQNEDDDASVENEIVGNEEKVEEVEASRNEDDEIEKQFNEILNETANIPKDKNAIQISENVSIDIEKIKQDLDTDEKKLPVFDEDEEVEISDNKVLFNEGDKVSHHKYGVGEVLKVIQYGERCLLQIEFPEVGKRLLDPKIAKLQMADEY